VENQGQRQPHKLHPWLRETSAAKADQTHRDDTAFRAPPMTSSLNRPCAPHLHCVIKVRTPDGGLLPPPRGAIHDDWWKRALWQVGRPRGGGSRASPFRPGYATFMSRGWRDPPGGAVWLGILDGQEPWKSDEPLLLPLRRAGAQEMPNLGKLQLDFTITLGWNMHGSTSKI
jgi:hypothetical protein